MIQKLRFLSYVYLEMILKEYNMPKFIKNDAMRLFESGVYSYLLALTGFNLPKQRMEKITDTGNAPIMGLLGATVELLAKGCLVQAKGNAILYRAGGQYKFGSETLDEVRSFVRDNDGDISFLWEAVESDEATKAQLSDSLNKFKLLQQYRANGLHAGIGTSRDVVAVVFSDVYEFICTLAECKRLKHIFRNLPHIEDPIVDRAVILEDLSRRIKASQELGEKANLLRAMYIMLPKLPEDEPEWFERVEKISIVPHQEDLTYLLKNMSGMHGIHFFKDRGAKTEGIPVYVDPKNPSAIPILPSNFKKELTQITDQFNSDVGVANGRLNDAGYLGLPPADFVIKLFRIDFLEANVIQDPDSFLTAQQTWPFVASALSVQGMHRPCWFLIRKCDELSKLKSILITVVDKGGAYLLNNSRFILEGIEAIISDSQLGESKNVSNFRETIVKSESKRDKLIGLIKGESERKVDLPEFYEKAFNKFLTGESPLGDVVADLIRGSDLEEDEKYWIRTALGALNRYEDRYGLVALYYNSNFKGYISEVRKLMRLVDFMEFGPKSALRK